MNLFLIVDRLDWAFGIIAQNLATELIDFNVKIVCTDDFKTVADLIMYLRKNVKEKSILHFFWRDYLMEVMNFTQRNLKYKEVLTNNIVTTHIPDHLFTYDDITNYERRIPLMNFVDGYFVSSSKLKDLYSGRPDFPPPHSIIYDLPTIPLSDGNHQNNRERKKIVWIGNSKWGEYLGYKDYKGLNTIVLPALDKLKKSGYHFDFIKFDSSQSKTDREVILKTLSEADILIISSEYEGTPLPLLEAMANSCAIVSTDVGIANEVLPEEQRQYIVSRDPEAFYDSLRNLLDDQRGLEELQRLNFLAFRQQFVDNGYVAEKWSLFFKEICSKSQNKFKNKFLHEHQATSLKEQLISKTIYNLSRLALHLNLMDTLKQYSLLQKIYYKFAGTTTNQVDYDLIDNVYSNKIAGKEILAFYSAYWSGVATSTASFFKDDSIQYPYYSYEFPQVSNHVYLNQLAEKLATSQALKSVIMSGGTQIQMELAKNIKTLNPKIKIFFAWHGSPAQWVDTSQYSTFYGWYELYRTQIVDGIISFKPDLDQILNAYDIRAFSVSNYVVSEASFSKKLTVPPDSTNFRVGLFAAMFSWYKNPFPQLLAIGLLKGCELVTNLHLDNNMKWVTSNIKITALTENLNNKRFIELLSRLHVVCYVTNTECSPMIALESASVGTPCIVGPAGNIYKDFPELELYLVEKEVDNPTAIRNRLQLVRDNYVDITILLNK
ncbi:glycosyltransferase, partial [Salmonella enterica subsp. enterica serovar Oranienburg]|nr:glycosyltransferase [Salmonella enterica subsp. enterica serovar Oranienburg]